MIKPGIIVSIQGYTSHTTEELTKEIISAGAVAVRTDKAFHTEIPVIGLHKVHVSYPEKEAYITPDVESIKKVSTWSSIVAIDYRKLNPNLQEISNFCRKEKIKVIADIGTIEDFYNIKEKDYYYNYIATTFTIFNSKKRFYPDIELAIEIFKEEKNVIAEGNIATREQVRKLFNAGIKRVCIGGAISNVYKLTRKFTSLIGERKK